MAGARIDDHSIAFCSFYDVVIHHCDSLLITDTHFICSLRILLSRWKFFYLRHVVFVSLHVEYSDTRARPFRNSVSEATQKVNVQIFEENTGWGLTTYLRIRLLNEFNFFLLLLFGCPWNRVELRLSSAIRDSVVFYFDKVLQIVICGRAFYHDGAPLHLNDTVIFNIDFSSEFLE